MRSRSVAFSLVLVLLLSLSAPLAAASRDHDDLRWDRTFSRIIMIIKKFFGPSSNGDGMIPPTP